MLKVETISLDGTVWIMAKNGEPLPKMSLSWKYSWTSQALTVGSECHKNCVFMNMITMEPNHRSSTYLDEEHSYVVKFSTASLFNRNCHKKFAAVFRKYWFLILKYKSDITISKWHIKFLPPTIANSCMD